MTLRQINYIGNSTRLSLESNHVSLKISARMYFFYEEKEYENPVEIGSVLIPFYLISHQPHSPVSSNATNLLIKLLQD